MKRYVVLFFSFLIILSASAQRFQLAADSAVIRIGEPLSFTLSLQVPQQERWRIIPFSDTLGNLEVLHSSSVDTVSVKQDVLYTSSFTVSAYDSGDFIAGPCIAVSSNGDTLYSNLFEVRVNTLDVDTALPFRDIYQPMSMPYTWRDAVPYLLGIGLLIILSAFLFYLKKKYNKSKTKSESRPKPKEPAHVWARAELRKLEELHLIEKGEEKQYHSRISDIIRLYLEYRFSYYAMESTTEQIQDEVGRLELTMAAREILMDLLRRADLVKFAKMWLPVDRHHLSMQQAYNFIDLTRQVESSSGENEKKS